MSGHFDDDEAVQCMGCGDIHEERLRLPKPIPDWPEFEVTTCPRCGDGPYRIPSGRSLLSVGPTDV